MMITDDLWNPILYALSRFRRLAHVEIVLLPDIPRSRFRHTTYNQTVVQFFKRPLDEIFPRTRRYTARVTLQEVREEKLTAPTYPLYW